jgi:hypothetical protein
MESATVARDAQHATTGHDADQNCQEAAINQAETNGGGSEQSLTVGGAVPVGCAAALSFTRASIASTGARCVEERFTWVKDRGSQQTVTVIQS